MYFLSVLKFSSLLDEFHGETFISLAWLKVIVEMVFPFVKNRDFPLEFFPFYIKKVVKLLVWIYSMITKYPIIVKY